MWRPTPSPVWTHVFPVGRVDHATVNLSKDNVFFGVRAVGADGHRGPAAYPLPA